VKEVIGIDGSGGVFELLGREADSVEDGEEDDLGGYDVSNACIKTQY
jgi:hypothetical protein